MQVASSTQHWLCLRITLRVTTKQTKHKTDAQCPALELIVLVYLEVKYSSSFFKESSISGSDPQCRLRNITEFKFFLCEITAQLLFSSQKTEKLMESKIAASL